jgi:signal transduction histidine kinase/DNA-binding NarL/FixJ family response regulator
VVLVGDAPDVRLLLRLALERDGDIAIVGEAGDAGEGVAIVRRAQPDIVLLDLSVPQPGELETIREVRAACPRARVLVFSGLEAEEATEQALRAGAHGSLQKGASPAAIRSYVRSVAAVEAPVLPGPRASGGASGGHPPRHADPTSRLFAALAADLSPVGLALVEGAGSESPVLSYVNPAATRLLGLPEDPLGHPLATVAQALFLLLERRAPHLEDSVELRDTLIGSDGRLELRLVRSGDDVLVTVHPPAESDDAARLRQAISTTVHEIRNPVTVITGAAAMIRESGPAASEAQHKSLLGAVVRQASVLDRVTEDLLTAAQATGGSLRLEVSSVALAPLLAEAVADLSGTEVDLRAADDLRARADATRLRQMVANLLSNALKYGEPPYVIEAARTHGPAGPQVVVAVADSGPGVAPDFRDQLFEEYSRADNTGSRGTGLGLYVVRSLAQAQNGTIDYHPRVGGGSVFTITLPEG